MNKRGATYTVVHSSSTYGPASPYAVVSTASGMPQRPTHRSKEEAQREAARLNEEAQREAEHLAAAARRKAARLRAEALTRDKGGTA